MDRNLDGFYLRIKEGDKFVNKCFTDMTREQQEEWLNKLEKDGLKRLCLEFASIIRNIGDQFDLFGE